MTSLGLVKTVAQGALGRARQMAAPEVPISRRFHRVAELTSGGMGVVHLAEDMHAGHIPVALKLPLNPNWNHQFVQEIQALSSLPAHENLTRLIDHGYDPERRLYWYTMPYHEGDLLSDKIKRGPLPVAEVLTVAKAVASGLASAAENGLIHKDLKPENIMFCLGGEIKVIDFGLTKIEADEGAVLGTPGRMAPEQIRSEKLDLRTDIFALGLIVQEMIDGHSPFAKNFDEILPIDLMIVNLKTAEKGLPRLRYCSIDDEVRTLTQQFVDKMTAFRPEDRYQTYEELIADAERIEASLKAFHEETTRELAALNPGPLTPDEI